MYFPKSYITPNQYSNGELFLIGTNTSYTGYYFTVLNGKTYTGRYPNDGEQLELTPPQNITTPTQEEDEGDSFYDHRFTPPNLTYSRINNTPETPSPIKVTPFYPTPTQQDYKLGEFTRYFSKKVNEKVYIETKSLSKNVLYIGFSLPWSITGDKDSTYNLNKRMVELKEEQLSISGFGDYLKHNYLKYYK